MGAADAEATGLSMDKIDSYALIASEALFTISGRQFGGTSERTVLARVGRAHGTRAKASLGSWWPVSNVSDVVGVPERGAPRALADDEWSWSGGIALTVPSWLAQQQVQALLTTGQAPPTAGRLAAKALAVELAINDPDYDGDEDTRLPALVSSVSRQGVSQSFVTVLDVLKEGATGVHEVDQFVAAHNPTKARSRPRVRTLR